LFGQARGGAKDIQTTVQVTLREVAKVRRCRLTVSNPELKEPTVSALEAGIS
jgi:hypothetical protein